MSTRLGLLLAIALCTAFAAGGAAEAAEWTVAKMSGHVVIRSGPLQDVAVTTGMVLKSGSVVVAGAGGRVLLVHGGDQMIVSPNSEVAIPRDGGGVTTVLERYGQVELDVVPTGKPHFIVETPVLAAVVKGTHFTVGVIGHKGRVTVERGKVEVDDRLTGEKVDVRPGQWADVAPGHHLTVAGSGALSPVLHGSPSISPAGSFASASLSTAGSVASANSSGTSGVGSGGSGGVTASADTTGNGNGNNGNGNGNGGGNGSNGGGNGKGNNGNGNGNGGGNGSNGGGNGKGNNGNGNGNGGGNGSNGGGNGNGNNGNGNGNGGGNGHHGK